MRKNIFLFILGLLVLITYSLHDILGALIFSEYNPLIHEVSMLTSIDAPSRLISTTFSVLYGFISIFLVIYVIIKFIKRKHKLLNVTLYVFLSMHIVSCFGYLLFPLSYGKNIFLDFIHVYVITSYVVMSSLASMIGFLICGIKNKMMSLIITSIFTILMMITGAIGTNLFVSLFGVFERMSSYSVVIFTSLIGMYLFKSLERNLL